MRYAPILLAFVGSALAGSGLALSPKPLPPDYANLSKPQAGAAFDPCRGLEGVSHIRCVQRHQRLPQSGHQNLAGAASGAGPHNAGAAPRPKTLPDR